MGPGKHQFAALRKGDCEDLEFWDQGLRVGFRKRTYVGANFCMVFGG